MFNYYNNDKKKTNSTTQEPEKLKANLSGTASKKSINTANKLATAASSIISNEQTKIVQEGKELERKTDNVLSSYIDYAELKKRVLKNSRVQFKENTFNDLVFLALSECYYHSLVFDDSFKESHSKRLKRKAYDSYKKMNESGMFDMTPKTNIARIIIGEAEALSKDLTSMYFSKEEIPKEKVDALIENYVAMVLEEAEDYTALVREKVQIAIRNEADYTAKLDELKTSKPKQYDLMSRGKHTTSLMESISKELVKKVIVETTVDTLDMQQIFGETVEYYTMLENVYTSKMIDIKPDALNEKLRRTSILKFEDLN